MKDERLIRKAYSEIVAGYTVSKYKGEYIFVKHFSPIDLLEFDYKYELALSEAIKRGIPTEEESLKLLCRDGLWGKDKEEEIKNTKEMITILDSNKRKHFAPKEIASFNQQIKDNEKYLIKLLTERAYKIGGTAETFARKRVDTDQVFHSFFKDAELKELLFKSKDIDELDNEDTQGILRLYERALESISHKMVRLAALSNDFQAIYSMAENIYEFYGKPVSKLTKSQVDLARYGTFYKNILSDEVKPPQEVINEPDDLEDWYNGRMNLNEIIEKNSDVEDGKTVSVVGVSKKDLNFYGIST